MGFRGVGFGVRAIQGVLVLREHISGAKLGVRGILDSTVVIKQFGRWPTGQSIFRHTVVITILKECLRGSVNFTWFHSDHSRARKVSNWRMGMFLVWK
jgi:hypothetical protein